MKTRLLMIATLLMAAAPTTARAAPYPQIYDLQGDANGIQGQSVQTAPVSYDPADILDVTLETAFDAVPVGEDGVDYRATGLRMAFHTTAPAHSDGPTMIYQVVGDVQGCRWTFKGFLAGPLTQAGEENVGKTEISRATTECGNPVISGNLKTIKSPDWTASLDEGTERFVLSVPFSGLEGMAEAEILREGAAISGLSAWTFANPCASLILELGCFPTHLDHSSMPVLPTFVIGEDMPADVPCTRGCP